MLVERSYCTLEREGEQRERKIVHVKKKKFVTRVKPYSIITPDTLTIQSALTGDNQINNEGKSFRLTSVQLCILFF